jgi:hypothetical protein
MVEDDVLLRQINRFAAFLARWLHGGGPDAEQQAALDAEATGLFGLDLATLRRLPPDQVPHFFPAEAPGGVGRWLLLARVLVHGARFESEAARAGRGEQAVTLIEQAMSTGHSIDPELLQATLDDLTDLTRS